MAVKPFTCPKTTVEMINDREANQRKVHSYMRQEIANCVESDTGEVNCTKLAENAAAQYNLYEDTTTYTIPEWVFDMAVGC
jgi:hypothetical protein